MEKPIIFTRPSGVSSETINKSLYAENLLLKALSDGVTNPRELQKLAGMRRVADVYTTLDRLSLRKGFHAALSKAGISMDYLVSRLKKISDNEDDEISLKAISTILKSLGLEKFEEVQQSGAAWEDAILSASSKNQVLETQKDPEGLYEVKRPEVTQEVLDKRQNEIDEAHELYGRGSDTETEGS